MLVVHMRACVRTRNLILQNKADATRERHKRARSPIAVATDMSDEMYNLLHLLQLQLHVPVGHHVQVEPSLMPLQIYTLRKAVNICLSICVHIEFWAPRHCWSLDNMPTSHDNLRDGHRGEPPWKKLFNKCHDLYLRLWVFSNKEPFLTIRRAIWWVRQLRMQIACRCLLMRHKLCRGSRNLA